MSEIKDRLEHLRGADYYAAWRLIWQEIGPDVRAAFAFLKAEKGYVTVWDLVDIADMMGSPFKPLVEALEMEGEIARGTYTRLLADNFSLTKTRAAIAAVRERERKSAQPQERRGAGWTAVRDLRQKETAL